MVKACPPNPSGTEYHPADHSDDSPLLLHDWSSDKVHLQKVQVQALPLYLHRTGITHRSQVRASGDSSIYYNHPDAPTNRQQ